MEVADWSQLSEDVLATIFHSVAAGGAEPVDP